jgi:hypothetical protein
MPHRCHNIDLSGVSQGIPLLEQTRSRAAPAFSFLAFCLAAPSSYRVDRGRHLASSTFAGLTALIMLSALTRAREAAPIPASSDADRPAPAGWVALRLLAARW